MVSVREPRTRARNGALRRIGSFPLFACGATLRMFLSMTFADPFTPTLHPPTSRCQSPRELCAKQSALRKLIPLGDRILVKRVEVLSQTAGGVFLPESGQKKANEGELVASTAGHHPVQWLRVQNQGGQLLLRNRALLGAAASLLRILAISSLMSSVEVTVGADKTVERALCAVTDFLKANFGSLSWRNKLGISSRAYSRMEEQLVMVVIRTTGFACLPLIRSVMGAAQCLLASRAQGTRLRQ